MTKKKKRKVKESNKKIPKSKKPQTIDPEKDMRKIFFQTVSQKYNCHNKLLAAICLTLLSLIAFFIGSLFFRPDFFCPYICKPIGSKTVSTFPKGTCSLGELQENENECHVELEGNEIKENDERMIGIKEIKDFVYDNKENMEILNVLKKDVNSMINLKKMESFVVYCNVLEIENKINGKKDLLADEIGSYFKQKGMSYGKIVVFENEEDILEEKPEEFDVLMYFFVDITRNVNLIFNIYERGKEFGFKKERVIPIQFAEAEYLKSEEYENHLIFEKGEFKSQNEFLEGVYIKIKAINDSHFATCT